MKEITIYYDDTRSSCRSYAELFAEQEGVTCQKISDLKNESILYEHNDQVGFLLEGCKEHISPRVRQTIQKLVMNKKGSCFVAATGGNHELLAVKSAADELKRRGYQVKNVYSQYIFEKYHLDMQEAVERILEDVRTGEENVHHYMEQMAGKSKHELRKGLHRELKQYRSYRRNKKKAL